MDADILTSYPIHAVLNFDSSDTAKAPTYAVLGAAPASGWMGSTPYFEEATIKAPFREADYWTHVAAINEMFLQFFMKCIEVHDNDPAVVLNKLKTVVKRVLPIDCDVVAR